MRVMTFLPELHTSMVYNKDALGTESKKDFFKKNTIKHG